MAPDANRPAARHPDHPRWVKALDSADPVSIAQAIFEIGEQRYAVLAPDVVRLAQSSRNDRVTEQALWAIGKLRYRPATAFVIEATHATARDVLRPAYWALGELGGPDAYRRLETADVPAHDPPLRAVIGGALKKLHGGTVRTPASTVLKRAKPPIATDPVGIQLLTALEAPEMDRARLLELREKLQHHDADLFRRYMDYVREKERVAGTLRTASTYDNNF